MIHYYTNREVSKKIEVNLARWKRWARSFLPPDPLGGMQSGYARQYTFRDLFKVFLGGHLLSHLKLSVPACRQVLADLSPWLKANGFFDLNGSNKASTRKRAQDGPYRIYFCPLPPTGAKGRPGFSYLIRRSVSFVIDVSTTGRQVTETMEETLLQSGTPDGFVFLQDPNVQMINISALVDVLVEKLHHQSR